MPVLADDAAHGVILVGFAHRARVVLKSGAGVLERINQEHLSQKVLAWVRLSDRCKRVFNEVARLIHVATQRANSILQKWLWGRLHHRAVRKLRLSEFELHAVDVGLVGVAAVGHVDSAAFFIASHRSTSGKRRGSQVHIHRTSVRTDERTTCPAR